MNETSRALCVEYVQNGQWEDVARLLGHIDEDIRIAAAAVCAGFASQRGLDLEPVVSALEERLRDEDEVAKEAAFALVYQHARRGEWEKVGSLLGHGRPLIRQVAGFGTGNAIQDDLDPTPVIGALRKNLADPDRGTMFCATRALVYLHASKEDAAAMRALLAHEIDGVAESARDIATGVLCVVADANNAGAIRTWLALGASPEGKNGDGETPLVVAAKRGAGAAVEALLAGGARIDAPDGARRTALMHAAYQGRENVVRLLLEKGADLNLVSEAEFTALDYAAKGNETSITKLLHERGGKMGDIASVMSFVCEQGNTEIARIVLEHGPTLDEPDANGLTPLMYAAMKGNAELVSLLLEKGADPKVDVDGRTARSFAEANGHAAIAERLKN